MKMAGFIPARRMAMQSSLVLLSAPFPARIRRQPWQVFLPGPCRVPRQAQKYAQDHEGPAHGEVPCRIWGYGHAKRRAKEVSAQCVWQGIGLARLFIINLFPFRHAFFNTIFITHIHQPGSYKKRRVDKAINKHAEKHEDGEYRYRSGG